MKLALLIAESRTRTPLPEPRREHFRTWDFLASLKIKRQVQLEMRVRSYFSRRWLWDARFPWLPASLSGRQERFQGQLGLTWDQGMGRLRLVGRFLQNRTENDSARRDLVQLDYRRTLRSWLHLRALYGTAWADPVDLVSAVSPLPGLVMPRHWGRWQSETLLSLGATVAGLELWVAVSRRLAAGDSSLPGSLNSWIEMRASW